MPDRKQKAGKIDITTKFTSEVKRSLLLEDAEKEYWIEKSFTLPDELVMAIQSSIKNKNDLMDKYILAAVKENPALLIELKNKINGIKKDALAAEEFASSPNVEEELKHKLENV